MSDDELNDDHLPTGRPGHSGVLFAMCLALILVVASVAALNLRVVRDVLARESAVRSDGRVGYGRTRLRQ